MYIYSENSKKITLNDVQVSEFDKEYKHICFNLMRDCIEESKEILENKNIKLDNENILSLANTLFNKRALSFKQFLDEKCREIIQFSEN